MTTTLAIDNNNDIYLDASGNIAVASGLQAVLMVCKNVSQTRLGEMVLQTDQGLPMQQALFIGQPNVLRYESALRKALLNVSGVVSVISIAVTVVDNTFRYVAIILTEFGRGVVDGDIADNL